MMILNDLQQDDLIEQMGQLTAAINGALNNSAAAAKDKALRDIATLLRVPIWSLTAKTSGPPGAYDRGPVASDVCGTLVGRGAGMASHKRSAHPAEAVAS